MKVWARVNHIGWIHLWLSKASYEAGEASEHFFNGKSDPRWQEAVLTAEAVRRLGGGELVEIEDPGYFTDEESEGEASWKDSSR